jgi:hypothetical protein
MVGTAFQDLDRITAEDQEFIENELLSVLKL